MKVIALDIETANLDMDAEGLNTYPTMSISW